MDFDPQVARHQPDDPLDLGRLEPLTGIDPALAEPVETQAAIRIDHHLDDRRVVERGADRRPHGGAQHGPLARPALGMAVVAAHGPPSSATYRASSPLATVRSEEH